MAIAYDNSIAVALNNPVTSQTRAFTITGSNTAAVVYALGDNAATSGFTSVLYNGVNLTKVTTLRVGSERAFDLWYLLGTATGSNNMVINRSPSGLIVSTMSSYTGVDSSGIGNTASAADSANTSLSGSITIGTANSWFVVGVRNLGSNISSPTGITLRQFDNGFGSYIADSNAALGTGAAAFGATWSGSIADGYIAVELKELASGYAGDIKSIGGVLQANIKSIAGVTNANIKSYAGVTNV